MIFVGKSYRLLLGNGISKNFAGKIGVLKKKNRTKASIQIEGKLKDVYFSQLEYVSDFIFQSKKIKIRDKTGTLSRTFGLEDGAIVDTVECPEEYRFQYEKHTWVKCGESRGGEPVRLLKDEYVIVD